MARLTQICMATLALLVIATSAAPCHDGNGLGEHNGRDNNLCHHGDHGDHGDYEDHGDREGGDDWKDEHNGEWDDEDDNDEDCHDGGNMDNEDRDNGEDKEGCRSHGCNIGSSRCKHNGDERNHDGNRDHHGHRHGHGHNHGRGYHHVDDDFNSKGSWDDEELHANGVKAHDDDHVRHKDGGDIIIKGSLHNVANVDELRHFDGHKRNGDIIIKGSLHNVGNGGHFDGYKGKGDIKIKGSLHNVGNSD